LAGVRPPELTGARYQDGIAGTGNWRTPPNISTNVPEIGIVRMGIDVVLRYLWSPALPENNFVD